jgi:uracil-DNA glycosylase
MATRVLEPDRDCPACPRLVSYRECLREQHPDWFNAPVPSFGPPTASLLVLGLAPGRSGANRTARPFTGDAAGALVYPALSKAGLATGCYAAGADDGLVLIDCKITNAVRCVPPNNRPLTQECANCRKFLQAEIGAMSHLKIMLALGRVAHHAIHLALHLREAEHPFTHGRTYPIGAGRVLVDSIATGRLTTSMFDKILTQIRQRLE